MPSNNQPDELRQWERDWRESIAGQLRDTVNTLSDVVGVVREMKDDVHELRAWKQELEHRKDDRIEKAPENHRANIAIIVSLIGVALYMLTDLAGLALLIISHWK
jgi:hypothetical protein